MKRFIKCLVAVLMLICVVALTGCGNSNQYIALEQAIGDLQTTIEDIQLEKDTLLEQIEDMEKQKALLELARKESDCVGDDREHRRK